MNAWRLNGIAGHLFRMAVIKGLKIPHYEIYKRVKYINHEGKILMDDGKVYEVVLKEIKNE